MEIMGKEIWLHIEYSEKIKDKVRAREILPERFVLLESSLVNLEFDVIPKGFVLYAKKIDEENYLSSGNYLDILKDTSEHTYIYEILTFPVASVDEFEQKIAPLLQENHLPYEIKNNEYLLIHTLEENKKNIDALFQKLDYSPTEIDLYDFGASYDDEPKEGWFLFIVKCLKWGFLPIFPIFFILGFISDSGKSSFLDIFKNSLEVTFFAVILITVFMFLGVGMESLFLKRFASPAYLVKMAKNKPLKAFAAKYKFLFFRDRWRGHYKNFTVEMKIDYNLTTYQTEYCIQAPVSETLYYDLEKLPKEYHFYHDLNYVWIYTYKPFWFSYPKPKKIEMCLDSMISTIQNIQIKILKI